MSTTVQWLAGFLILAIGFLLGLAQRVYAAGQKESKQQAEIEKISRDVQGIGNKVYKIQDRDDRRYLRHVAYLVEEKLKGEDGKRLARMIREDRVD